MPPATTHTSLAINLDQWRGEIGRYFGFGRTYSSMTGTQQADVDAVIDRGLRQFYAPPILQDGTAHVWSFMRPTMNISVHAPFTTGKLTSVTYTPKAEAEISSLGASSLPLWVKNGVLIYKHPLATKNDDAERMIHIFARQDSDTLDLDDAVAEDVYSGTGIDYVITDGIYGLPTSFGGIEGNVTLESGSGYMPVKQVSEDQIREMFLNGAIQSGVPAYFCVRPYRFPSVDRIGNSAKIGMYTRYEMVFYPRPDNLYRMSFKYLYVFPGVADLVAVGEATTDLHPPGMAYHHETILASCLAVAEEYADSPNGKYKEYFRNRIAASVALDRRVAGSSYFGENIDRSDTLHSQGRAPIRTQVTYNNTLY